MRSHCIIHMPGQGVERYGDSFAWDHAAGGRTIVDVGRGIGEALNGADNTDSRRENAVTNDHGCS